MEENSVLNCHWYCHCFRNEKDSHYDHPELPAAPLISIMTIRAEACNRRVVTMTTLLFKWSNDSICSFHRHNRYIRWNSNRWYHYNWTRYINQVINESRKNLYMGMHATTAPLLCTETKTLSLRRNYHHRFHWKLQPLDNLPCSQRWKLKKLSLRCMSDMETRSGRSPHVNARCWGCYYDHPSHSQWSKGCHSTEAAIFRSQLLLQI